MTVSISRQWAGELLGLLDEQRTIYRDLRELSGRQTGLVASGDAESLLSVLAQRQSLIDRLTQLSGLLEPYRRDWARLWGELDGLTRGRVQSCIAQVQELLEEIVQQDERDRAALSAHRDRLADDLRQVKRGSALHRVYGVDPAQAQPGVTDHQG